MNIVIPSKSTYEKFFTLYQTLTEEQVDVFNRCVQHILGDGLKQTLVVRASAGTGKTHTAKVVDTFCAIHNIKITKTSLTGRASSNVDGQTHHSLLFDPVIDEETGDLIRWIRKDPQAIRQSSGQAILVEEGSMTAEDMFKHIEKIGLPIIVFGDDSQNDPVQFLEDGQIPFNPMTSLESLGAEHVTLRDMRRFNPDSGIAKLAERLREDNVIRKIRADDVKYLPRRQVNVDFFKKNDIDVVICGTNKTRRYLNAIYREGNGWDPDGLPAIGETVMCLKNDVISKIPISNGELFTVMFAGAGEKHARYMLRSLDHPDKTLSVDVQNDTWTTEQVSKEGYSKKQKFGQFTFGYVMTSHKAQGSTFNNVLFVDDDVSFFLDQRKYRYTGITRAAKRLWVTI